MPMETCRFNIAYIEYEINYYCSVYNEILLILIMVYSTMVWYSTNYGIYDNTMQIRACNCPLLRIPENYV